MKGLRLLNLGHDDTAIQWEISYEGAITSPVFGGIIAIRYSSVAPVLHNLALGLDNFDFIPEEYKEKILKEERVDNDSYDWFSKLQMDTNKFAKSIWSGKYEGKDVDKENLERLRKTYDIKPLMDNLKEKKIPLSYLDFYGVVEPTGQEYDKVIHFLKSPEDNGIVLSQDGERGMNIVKMSQDDTEEIMNQLIGHYNYARGGLRKLLEDSEKA